MQLTESVGRVRRTRKPKLCECGCGQVTKLSDRTSTKRGVVKGKPLAFIKGHNAAVLAFDLSGEVYGRLTVLREVERSNAGSRMWLCLCTCGVETVVHSGALTQGHTKSCGCLKYESRNKRHGMSYSPVWFAWWGMLQRCSCTTASNYKDYGGRGITVCKRWQVFENFRDDMLPTWFSGGTLEREDNEGNYSPQNCKWATKKEQARNRRTTNWVEVFGERLSFAEAVEKYGVVKYGIARQRIYRNGWNIEDALTTP